MKTSKGNDIVGWVLYNKHHKIAWVVSKYRHDKRHGVVRVIK